MKDKSKVLKTYRDVCDKLQFIGLIGGAGFQPAAAAGCRYSKHAAAAGYKPAPQLGRQIAVY